MVKLGVNIDHIATIRQARKGNEPDPVFAAYLCETAGADGITVHLREDRRHIQDRDVRLLRQTVKTKLNLEMSVAEEIVRIALEVKPDDVCIVPEKRQELTTEGGLDVIGNKERLKKVVKRLKAKDIRVSLFVEPDLAQIKMAKEIGAECVELHTGKYASALRDSERKKEIEKLIHASETVRKIKLGLNAGHGLNYKNVIPVAQIEGMNELNIGHSIVARASIVGIYQAVKEMKSLIFNSLIL